MIFVILCSFFEIQEEINEEDERLMEAFISKEPGQQKTLADLIVQRIKEKDASIASGNIWLRFIFLLVSLFLILGIFLLLRSGIQFRAPRRSLVS